MVQKILIIFILIGLSVPSDKNGSLSLYFYNFQNDNSEIKKNDIFKPMLMSLLIPGLGQYKQGNEKKALIFFGIELASLYANSHYDNEGNQKVSDYKSFSNDHWNFEDWIINYDCWNDDYEGINNDCDYSLSHLFSNTQIDDNGNVIEDYLSIWEHSHHINFYYNNILVSTNDEIFEDLYFEFTTWDPTQHENQSFVDFYDIQIVKDHHFYEGIRKYNMFFSGWDDAITDIEEVIQPSGYATANSPNKKKYNNTWNESIELYDYAQYAVTAIYLNHVISMFDVYFKDKFDNRLDVKMQNNYLPNLKCANFSFKLSVKL